MLSFALWPHIPLFCTGRRGERARFSIRYSILNVASRSSIYTIIWNTMDYPALILPVTTVDPALDVKPVRESFWSEDDEVVYKMCE